MPVILMDDLVDSIKPGGKQHLCALSTRLCGTTNTNLLPHMSSVIILHSFFKKNILKFPVVLEKVRTSTFLGAA